MQPQHLAQSSRRAHHGAHEEEGEYAKACVRKLAVPQHKESQRQADRAPQARPTVAVHWSLRRLVPMGCWPTRLTARTYQDRMTACLNVSPYPSLHRSGAPSSSIAQRTICSSAHLDGQQTRATACSKPDQEIQPQEQGVCVVKASYGVLPGSYGRKVHLHRRLWRPAQRQPAALAGRASPAMMTPTQSLAFNSFRCSSVEASACL